MVMVDKLTKVAHFVPTKMTHKTTNIAYIYMKQISRLHGILNVDTERGVNQYQVQFKTFFNLYLNHSTISNEK
jgi:hypothetical protein